MSRITDGVAVIGTGSEWFWTALSGLVLAVTFLAIHRPLRLQRTRAAIDQVDAVIRDFHSERMPGHRLALLLAWQAGVDREQPPRSSGLCARGGITCLNSESMARTRPKMANAVSAAGVPIYP